MLCVCVCVCVRERETERKREYTSVNMIPQRYASHIFRPSGTYNIRLCLLSNNYATNGNHSNLNGKSQDFADEGKYILNYLIINA